MNMEMASRENVNQSTKSLEGMHLDVKGNHPLFSTCSVKSIPSFFLYSGCVVLCHVQTELWSFHYLYIPFEELS